ncbi:MAG: sodium:proton exchanger [Bacteroidetes bacterium GWC2_33_15]|nr:MAG: sodium:proton exchanger [Bacteroidetes bacterium GWA2_33_15]OFX52242.1 MAG: sodium:proton exchanger [Bacteroidetes bacterium GWC2_33_15]OFX64396.1 MAG: sodium:proton exchanger [Bacteroidetes bacterium GWB2_32_14]OFX67801.1 MAG: sodium:proton exchanger [Bacteroidetes bacterium GWD2_33_33]HAN19413.1 sodium:proton exchanger [Bacteroidales bacterium]
MLNFLLLVTGFIVLIYGANLLVDSASALAKKLNVPTIVIGLTIVALGTSAPELVVNIFAAIDHNSNIALGNVVGSNLFNIFAILGISAFIYPLTVKSKTTWIEVPLALLSAIILLVLANDVLIDKNTESVISRIDGIIFVSFFLIFIVYNIQLILSGSYDEEFKTKNYSIKKSILFIIGGVIFLVLGGKAIVYSATEIARLFGIPERIISLTIISIGTSLPELATSVIAARKKNVDIAIGNIVGSNIFNVFFILGTSAIIYPVTVSLSAQYDLLINILASLLLFIFIFTGKGRKINRWEGLIFMILYVLYIISIIVF